jgi:hypothetical protein
VKWESPTWYLIAGSGIASRPTAATYPRRHKEIVSAHPASVECRDRPKGPGSRRRLRLEAFDWNCSQHITPRFTEAEIADAIRPLRDRLEALESENAALRAQFQKSGKAP